MPMTIDEFFAEAKRLGCRMVPDDPAMVREILDRKDAEIAKLRAELAAWQFRFPLYAYRPQDDCISRKAGG